MQLQPSETIASLVASEYLLVLMAITMIILAFWRWEIGLYSVIVWDVVRDPVRKLRSSYWVNCVPVFLRCGWHEVDENSSAMPNPDWMMLKLTENLRKAVFCQNGLRSKRFSVSFRRLIAIWYPNELVWKSEKIPGIISVFPCSGFVQLWLEA